MTVHDSERASAVTSHKQNANYSLIMGDQGSSDYNQELALSIVGSDVNSRYGVWFRLFESLCTATFSLATA